MHCTVQNPSTGQTCDQPAAAKIKLPNCKTDFFFCQSHFDAWRLQQSRLPRAGTPPVIQALPAEQPSGLFASPSPPPPPPDEADEVQSPPPPPPPPDDCGESDAPPEPQHDLPGDGIRTDGVVVFDLETTGTNIVTDRIVQFCASIYHLGDQPGFSNDPSDCLYFMVNPGIPISPEASEVHGITDADVEGRPKFSEMANQVVDFLQGRYLVGYNINSFDVPFLAEELHRCGISWRPPGSIDVLNIWRKAEPRNLVEAAKRFAEMDHIDAHDALADVMATGLVMRGMVRKLEAINGMGLDELAQYSRMEDAIDLKGVIIMKNGQPCFNIGERKGRPVADDPGFAKWILTKDFTHDTKQVIRRILSDMGDYSWQR
jgi:DNA polymerase-3 subunit epsilon